MRAYLAMKTTDKEKERTELFLSIKKIAYAILMVGNYSTYNLNYEDVAYEYAVYMFTRLVATGKGKFVPEYQDRFPWQKYISLNIRHIIHSRFLVSDDALGSDIVDLLDDGDGDDELRELITTSETSVDRMTKEYTVSQIYDVVKQFYSQAEIARLYPITKQYLTSHGVVMLTIDCPADVKAFAKVLIAVSKRILYQGVKTDFRDRSKSQIEDCVSSSLKSTLFMASVIEADFFPTDLLLALDLDSILRLVTISGGSTIRIPTTREFESIIGATMAASKMIIDGETDVTKAKWEAKHEYGLVFSNRVNMSNFIDRIMSSCHFSEAEGGKPTSPLIHLLLTYIKSLNTITDTLIDKTDTESYDTLVSSFGKLVDISLNIIDSLTPKDKSQQ